MNNFEVIAVQLENNINSIDENIINIEKQLKKIKQDYPKTDLVIFPELTLNGYDGFEFTLESYKNNMISKGIDNVCSLANKYCISLLLGYIEVSNDNFYNSICFINNRGKKLANYRKIHLVKGLEKKKFTSGDNYVLVKTKGFKIGLMICYDASFPEQSRLYSIHDADLLVVCAAWEEPYLDQWKLSLRSRAHDNSIYIIGCNATGKGLNHKFFGHSMVCDPMGNIVKIINFNKNDFIHYRFNKFDRQKFRDDYCTHLDDCLNEKNKETGLKIYQETLNENG